MIYEKLFLCHETYPLEFKGKLMINYYFLLKTQQRMVVMNEVGNIEIMYEIKNLIKYSNRNFSFFRVRVTIKQWTGGR